MNRYNTPSHQGNGLSTGGPLSGKIGKLARGTTLAITMGLAGGLVQAKNQNNNTIGSIVQTAIQQASTPSVSPMNNHNFELPPGSRINKTLINGQVPLFYMLALKHENIEGYQVDINQWEGLRLPGENPETRKENVLKIFLENAIKNHPTLNQAETIYITTAKNPTFPKKIEYINNRKIVIDVDDSRVNIGEIIISNASIINPQFTARMSKISELENNDAAKKLITILCGVTGLVIGVGAGVRGKIWYDNRNTNDNKENQPKPANKNQKEYIAVADSSNEKNHDDPNDWIVNDDEAFKAAVAKLPKLPELTTPVPEAPVPEAPVPEAPVPEAPVPEAPVPEAPVPANKTPTHPKAGVPITKNIKQIDLIIGKLSPEQIDSIKDCTPEQIDSFNIIIPILEKNNYKIIDIKFEPLDNDGTIDFIYYVIKESHHIKIKKNGDIEKLDEKSSSVKTYSPMTSKRLERFFALNKHPTIKKSPTAHTIA